MSEEFSLRELFLMGYFDVPSKSHTITKSGRKTKYPPRYQNEKYPKDLVVVSIPKLTIP